MVQRTVIHLTTSRYYSPGRRAILAKGIVPDIAVQDPSSSGLDSVIFRLLEADLDKHLLNHKLTDDKPGNAGKNLLPPSDNNEDGARTKPAEFGSQDDYQLNQALNLLKGIEILRGK